MTRILRIFTILVTLASASFAQSARDQLLDTPFQAGVTHVQGNYGFTQDNFLIEGANRVNTFGSDAIFIYMEPQFRSRYPDKSNSPSWPAGTPSTLTELAQTAPYKAMLGMPFKTFVITAYAFTTMDSVENFAINPDAAAFEEQEFYDLTRYLLMTYAGTGKTFILKIWEGDYTGLQSFDTTKDISPTMIDAMNIWLKARQRGISRARNDAGNPSGVGVFHAVEAARVLDYSRSGLTRLINAVVPVVKPDMVSYSSYEASLAGTDAASAAATIREALDVIKSLAPDPLNLGNKRIFISEYGLFENERPADEVVWRTNTILQTSQAAGIFGAFLWQLFDNECTQSDGSDFPTDTSPGDALRPTNSQCRGLWLVKPDGATSPVLPLISPYWKPSTSGVTLTGRVTSAANGAGLGGATISFYGGEATTDGSGNYTLGNVPAKTTQLTASAASFQNSSVSVAVNGTQNSPVNFALTSASAAGSITGRVTNALNGLALSGVTVRYSGGSTTTDSTGAFRFSTIAGGTYDVTAQLSGWIPITTSVTVQPGIATVFRVRLSTGAKLAGRVTNTSGAAVAGATVNVHGGAVPTNVSVLTDASGNYDSGWIPIGSYQALATASGFGPTIAAVTLTVGTTTTQNLVLGPPTPDFGLPVSPDFQNVIAGQSTSFLAAVNPVRGFNGTVVLSTSGLPSGASASFNPASLASGTSMLTLNTSSGTPAGTYTINVVGTSGSLQRTTQIVLVVKAAITTGTASGRVTRASNGTGIAGAKVSTSFSSTTTDASGNYTLTNLPAGSMQFTASASGFTSLTKTVTINAGQTTAASFALAAAAPTGSITGRITSAVDGHALSGATVTSSRGSTVSDANGYYTFKAVPPGTYTVTAQLTGWISASTPVTVASTAVTANIRLATGGKITGKVVNRSGVAISGASVKITGGLVPTTVTLSTNSSGVYLTGWIAIGNYTVQVSKSGYTTQSKSTSMSSGQTATVNFTLQ
jgi:protocatechuate 3,4-dioxygenase beta subunit